MCVLCSSPKSERSFFFRLSRRTEKNCHLFCAHQRPSVFLSYDWPLCADGDPRVGPSPYNERTPFRLDDEVVGFIDRYLSRTHKSRRFELSIRLSVSEADVGPTSAPEIARFGLFQEFGTFRLPRIWPRLSRSYGKILTGIF